MNRRDFVLATTAASLAAATTATASTPGADLAATELSLADIEAGFASGRLTSVALTRAYLGRIEATNLRGPGLRAVLETNPGALQAAATLDAERKAGRLRGALHGVPVLIKDNVETADRMMTTAGSLALEGWYAPDDAPLVARLRAAGAVILGKTNMSEWANFRSTHSSSGWSGRGGQTRNPYALDRSPSRLEFRLGGGGRRQPVRHRRRHRDRRLDRQPGRRSTGSSASSRRSGLISRRGIIPISHSQDTAGPIARSVRDAALMLGVMCGLDPQDAASAACDGHFEGDYTRYLDRDGLRGARLGVARNFFADYAPMNRFLDRQVALLKGAGAVIVDPLDLTLPGAVGDAELQVLLYEFKADLNTWLTRLPATFPARDLAGLIRFDEAHASEEMPLFDQELLRMAEATQGLGEKAYLDARAACLAATRANGIDRLVADSKLDAIVALTSGPAWLIDAVNGDYDTGGCSSPAAIAGYPHVTVPAGLHAGLPVGLSFFGPAFSEGRLLRLASGFEAVAAARVAPHLQA